MICGAAISATNSDRPLTEWRQSIRRARVRAPEGHLGTLGALASGAMVRLYASYCMRELNRGT